jgi:DNA-binding MarR family transcriptional regulator
MITINENVLQNKNIPSSAKLLLGYVQSKGSLSETNEQLANRFGVTPVSITNWVSRLEKAGFVELKYEKRRRTITAKQLD